MVDADGEESEPTPAERRQERRDRFLTDPNYQFVALGFVLILAAIVIATAASWLFHVGK